MPQSVVLPALTRQHLRSALASLGTWMAGHRSLIQRILHNCDFVVAGIGD